MRAVVEHRDFAANHTVRVIVVHEILLVGIIAENRVQAIAERGDRGFVGGDGLFEPYFLLAEQFRAGLLDGARGGVAVGVGDGQGNGVLDLGDQSQHQKLVLGGGDVIARYRGRLTRRAGTADIAGTVGVAGGGLTVCGGRLIAGDGVGRVIRVPLSGNGVADGGGLIGGEVHVHGRGVGAVRVHLGVDAVDCAFFGVALVGDLGVHHLLVFVGIDVLDLGVEPLHAAFLDGGADVVL